MNLLCYVVVVVSGEFELERDNGEKEGERHRNEDTQRQELGLHRRLWWERVTIQLQSQLITTGDK